jgi:hypothetical protein
MVIDNHKDHQNAKSRQIAKAQASINPSGEVSSRTVRRKVESGGTYELSKDRSIEQTKDHRRQKVRKRHMPRASKEKTRFFQTLRREN